MKLLFSPCFLKQYRDAPLRVQKAFDKQAKLLVQDLRHSGLHASKYDESRETSDKLGGFVHRVFPHTD